MPRLVLKQWGSNRAITWVFAYQYKLSITPNTNFCIWEKQRREGRLSDWVSADHYPARYLILNPLCRSVREGYISPILQVGNRGSKRSHSGVRPRNLHLANLKLQDHPITIANFSPCKHLRLQLWACLLLIHMPWYCVSYSKTLFSKVTPR